MKSKFFFTIVLMAGLMLVNFSVNHVYGQTQKKETNQQKIIQYTCSMHPDVIKDKPGNCPKCGMKLIEKKEDILANKYQVKDSCTMKHDHEKMMCDSTMVKKEHMKHDSTLNKQSTMKK